MVASLQKLAGLDGPVPDYSTLCRRQRATTIQIPCRRSDGNLNLLGDSTGVKMRADGEWQCAGTVPAAAAMAQGPPSH